MNLRIGINQLPGFHPHLWANVEDRQIPRSTQDHPQAALCQIGNAEGGASKTQASVHGGAREKVEVCSTGLLQLSRSPRESGQPSKFSVTRITNRNDAAEVERSYRTNLSKGEVGLIRKIEGPGVSGELLDRLKADYELQGKGSVQNLSHLARAKKDFGAKRSEALTADDIKNYQRRRVEAGNANGTINRILQLVLRAYSLENETRGKKQPSSASAESPNDFLAR